MMEDVEAIVRSLTPEQRSMLLRPPGRYEDVVDDVAALLNLEIWGTCNGPKFDAVRTYLLSQTKE